MRETETARRVPAFGLPTEPVGQGPETLRVRNPVAAPPGGQAQLAKRPGTLAGKRIADRKSVV